VFGTALLVALGAALPTLLTLLWFLGRGALSDLAWTLGEFTPGYTALSWQDRRAADMLYHAIEEVFFKFSALAAAGVVAAIAMRPTLERERELVFLLLGVIAIQLAGVAMQGKFFAYHYAATLPLIAAIAGMGLYKLWQRCLSGGAGDDAMRDALTLVFQRSVAYSNVQARLTKQVGNMTRRGYGNVTEA
jgi:hypothetical protein